jgi:hypothetical protein
MRKIAVWAALIVACGSIGLAQGAAQGGAGTSADAGAEEALGTDPFRSGYVYVSRAAPSVVNRYHHQALASARYTGDGTRKITVPATVSQGVLCCQPKAHMGLQFQWFTRTLRPGNPA